MGLVAQRTQRMATSTTLECIFFYTKPTTSTTVTGTRTVKPIRLPSALSLRKIRGNMSTFLCARAAGILDGRGYRGRITKVGAHYMNFCTFLVCIFGWGAEYYQEFWFSTIDNLILNTKAILKLLTVQHPILQCASFCSHASEGVIVKIPFDFDPFEKLSLNTQRNQHCSHWKYVTRKRCLSPVSIGQWGHWSPKRKRRCLKWWGHNSKILSAVTAIVHTCMCKSLLRQLVKWVRVHDDTQAATCKPSS